MRTMNIDNEIDTKHDVAKNTRTAPTVLTAGTRHKLMRWVEGWQPLHEWLCDARRQGDWSSKAATGIMHCCEARKQRP